MLFHINQIFKWGMGHVRTPCMHVRHTHTIPKERSYQKKKKKCGTCYYKISPPIVQSSLLPSNYFDP